MDNYVECAECGHPLERHTPQGCDSIAGCDCPTRWTVREVERARRHAGLPGRFHPYDH